MNSITMGDSYQIQYIGDSFKFFSAISLQPLLLINLHNKEMSNKKYCMNATANVIYALQTEVHSKGEDKILCHM